MILFFSFPINAIIELSHLLFCKFLEDKDEILFAALSFIPNIYLPMSGIERKQINILWMNGMTYRWMDR